jgi:putative tryptophan/tyrosine transport system substrate-binding protein
MPFPAFASDFVRRQVSVIAASSPQGALAAKRATTAIPVVFSIGADPVEVGLVSSLSHPGGNVTGVYQFTAGLESKRLGLLHEMVPKAEVVGVLVNPNYAAAESQLRDVQEAAANLGLRLVIVRANIESEFDAAFSTVVTQRGGAMLVCASPFFNSRRQQLVVLASSHALPAIFEWRDFAVAGGLMSYGTSLNNAYRQAGIYAGRMAKKLLSYQSCSPPSSSLSSISAQLRRFTSTCHPHYRPAQTRSSNKVDVRFWE